MEWYWHIKLFPIISKILSVFFAVLSIFLLIGECTLFLNTNAGVFPLFFEKEHGSVGTQILCFFPMAYIFCTTYIGLFTLRLPGSYGLYNKNHTDPANLVWSAFFSTRLVQPLIYNFLKYIRVTGTQFQKVMGVMDLVPLGNEFSTYFPMLIIVFAVLNALDFYTWIMTKLGMPSLSFSDRFDNARLEEGKELIKKGNA
jgi:hypothetical protein